MDDYQTDTNVTTTNGVMMDTRVRTHQGTNGLLGATADGHGVYLRDPDMDDMEWRIEVWGYVDGEVTRLMREPTDRRMDAAFYHVDEEYVFDALTDKGRSKAPPELADDMYGDVARPGAYAIPQNQFDPSFNPVREVSNADNPLMAFLHWVQSTDGRKFTRTWDDYLGVTGISFDGGSGDDRATVTLTLNDGLRQAYIIGIVQAFFGDALAPTYHSDEAAVTVREKATKTVNDNGTGVTA